MSGCAAETTMVSGLAGHVSARAAIQGVVADAVKFPIDTTRRLEQAEYSYRYANAQSIPGKLGTIAEAECERAILSGDGPYQPVDRRTVSQNVRVGRDRCCVAVLPVNLPVGDLADELHQLLFHDLLVDLRQLVIAALAGRA